MDLVAIENSRVIYLTQIHRPSGQLYLPEAAAKLVHRYSFVQFPSADELRGDMVSFGIGKFDNVQIQELKIYSDGIIVSSRSNTNIIDAFIDDLFGWLRAELGLVPVVTAKAERHYESMLVVRSEVDLPGAIVVRSSKDALEVFNKVWRKDYSGSDYRLSSVHFDSDPQELLGRKRPNFFGIERRAGTPFEENVFFSVSPLKTQDHLDVLQSLEDLSRGR